MKSPTRASERPREELRGMLDAKVACTVVLAEKVISLETLLHYSVGSVIVLPGVDRDRLRLEVSGTEVARGTTVMVGSGLGIRLNEVRPAPEFLPRIVDFSVDVPRGPR